MIFLILAILAVIVAAVVYQIVKLRRVVSQNHGQLGQSVHAEMLVELSFNADTITAKYPDGGTISVKWSELTTVGLASIEAPAGSPALYWGLHNGKRLPTISYPHGAIGDKELLTEFAKRLPGFDMDKVMQAVGTTGRAHFQIWPKK